MPKKKLHEKEAKQLNETFLVIFFIIIMNEI